MSKTIKDSKDYKEYKKIFNGETRYDKITGEEVKPINSYLTGDSGDAIAYIEETYPETAKEFQKIQFEQYLTFCKKQMDYGPSNISMGTGVGEHINKALSTTALIIRINDKVQRLLNLVVTNKRKAQNEPVEDAFKDLSVYGIIAQIVRNGKWGV